MKLQVPKIAFLFGFFVSDRTLTESDKRNLRSWKALNEYLYLYFLGTTFRSLTL